MKNKMQKTPTTDKTVSQEKKKSTKTTDKKKTKNPEKPFSQQSLPDNYSFEVGM